METNLPQQSTFHLGYRPALDGIRGFAVLWVIGFHFYLPFGRDGLFGVDMFFTLSGFLITILLIEEWERSGKIYLKNFYIRRILRLFPALVVLLLVISVFSPNPYVLSTFFYSTNWIKALHLQPDNPFLDHTWSLSIEEQYYFFWPLFLQVLLKTKIPRKYIFIVPLVLGLGSALARIIVWTSTHDWFRVYMGTDLHADGLLLGSAFGLMTIYGFVPSFLKYKRIYSLVTLITFLLLIWLLVEKQLTQSFIPIFGNLGVALGTIVLISRLVNYPSKIVSRIFCFLPMVKIGVISYGLYLWHAPVGAFIENIGLEWSPIILTGLKLGGTFLIASLSYWMVEKPILLLKNRYMSKQ